MLQTIFTLLIALQFAVVALHDLVDIPGWTHARQMRAVLGPKKLLIGTLINSIFPGIALGLAAYYWNTAAPTAAENYWVFYCGITVVSAIGMWWIPYFFGASEKTRRMYTEMYAGTKQVLPPRGNNPRPNLLHLYFHALFAATLALAIVLRVRDA